MKHMYVFFDLLLTSKNGLALPSPLPLKLYMFASVGIQSSPDVGMEGQLTNFGDFYPKKYVSAKKTF